MTEAPRYLRHSHCARAVLGILRWCPLTATQLAYLLRERFGGSTVRQAVCQLRRLGRIGWSGSR